MKNCKIYKAFVGWMLAGVFILPYVAKSVHGIESDPHHATADCRHHNGHHHHNHPCDDCTCCKICQFTVFLYTKTKVVAPHPVVRELNVRIITDYKEEIYIPFYTTNLLRAPPTMLVD
ncbi:MAG: hypothetical protein LBS80_02450 [Tannerella sp.]|nr:hypothetical protein [Tannerella sp.]